MDSKNTSSSSSTEIKKNSLSRPKKIITGILLILSLALFGLVILDYTKIYPLERIIQMPTHVIPKEKISVSSEVSNITISLIDKERLERYLDEMGLFDKGRVGLIGIDKNLTIENLQIVITDQPQNLYPMVNQDRSIRYGLNTKYDGDGTLKILVYFSPEYLATSDNERLSSATSAQVLYVVHSVTKKLPKNNPSAAMEILKSYGERIKNEGLIFTVRQKN